MSKFIDLTGQRFGNLLVLAQAPMYRGQYSMWLVLCDCGKTHTARGCHLRSGGIKKCPSCKGVKHGGYKTRLYSIWAGMKTRCNNPNDTNYKYYGGAGVTYSENWESFVPFKEWALASGYKDGLELDRYPDRTGKYAPTNCRWVTHQENCMNRTTCIDYKKELSNA